MIKLIHEEQWYLNGLWVHFFCPNCGEETAWKIVRRNKVSKHGLLSSPFLCECMDGGDVESFQVRFDGWTGIPVK